MKNFIVTDIKCQRLNYNNACVLLNNNINCNVDQWLCGTVITLQITGINYKNFEANNNNCIF